MTLLRWLTFLLGSLTVTLTVLIFQISLFLMMLLFVLQWLFRHWEILIMLSQFPLTFHQTQSRVPHFIAQLVAILEGTGAVFGIIQEMSHGRISLNSVLLVLLKNFVSGLTLEFMYISLIKSIRPSLTYLHGFQLLLLLPQFMEITFFVCSSRTNLLNLKESSNVIVIIPKVLLKLPKLHLLIEQKSPSFPRNLTFRSFGELPIVFSTQVNLLYLSVEQPVGIVFCIR